MAFWNKKVKRAPKTKTDPITREKVKRMKEASRRLDELAAKNSAWMEYLVAKEFGIQVPTAASKSVVEAKKDKLEEAITEAAFEAISNDPELKSELARSKAHEILGIKTPRISKDDNTDMIPYDDESPLTRAMREMRELQEFQEEMGISGKKDSGFSFLKDPEVIKAFLAFASNMMKNNNNGSSPEQYQSQPQVIRQPPIKIFVVDGREMNEAEYLQLKQAEQQKVLEQPKSEVKKEIEELKQEEDPILKYLDYEPEKFVEELNNVAGSLDGPEKQQALFLQTLLEDTTYDEICEMLEPYKENEKFKPYIEKIVSRKEWVEAVIEEFQKSKENRKSIL